MIYQDTRRALGTDCLITINSKDEKKTKKFFNNLWSVVEVFEARYSRFIKSSELSYININAGSDIEISKELKDILDKAIEYSKATDGLYNPFILPLLQSVGYKGSWPNPNIFDEDLDFSTRKIKDINKLKIVKNKLTIPKDSALDLGGIGKGYLLDKLSKILENEFDGYWISLGGDIVADGFQEADHSWKIFIESGTNEEISSYVDNKGKYLAIATSGTNRRSTNTWNHIINPKTEASSESDILTATVVCPDPIKADILASCFLLLKSNQAKDFASKFKIDVYLQKNYSTENSKNVIYLGNRGTFKP